ncbi:hypothetical protein M3Y94_00984000 [Aphelenchoides besseyi]|nr:hypothetical protein M3Y94_00984000 [Aphelenchoides besseyi]KAI6221085.1 hypothetical protein M3Y95_01003600 [Aphelenchoides besseyi]
MCSKVASQRTPMAQSQIKKVPKKRKLNTILLDDKIEETNSKPKTTNIDATKSVLSTAFNVNSNGTKVDVNECKFANFDLRPIVGGVDRRIDIGNSKAKKLLLKVPAIKAKLKVDVHQSEGERAQRVTNVEIRNMESENKMRSSKLIVNLSANRELWSIGHDHAVNSLCANQNWIVLSSSNRQLYVYATNSGCLQSMLLLESPAVFSSIAEHMCAVVDEKADILTWDLQRMKLVASRSLISIINGVDTKITGCSVTNDGTPVVFLDNGDVWFHSTKTNTWKQVRTSTSVGFQMTSYFEAIKREVPNGVIAKIVLDDKKLHETTDSSTVTSAADEERQLEKLCCALIELKSSVEYHLLASIYINLIVTREKVHKLKHLLTTLETVEPSSGIDVSKIYKELAHLFDEHPNVKKKFEQLKSGGEVVDDDDEDFAFI